MKHKRDDGAEKQEDETVDVTPVMIGVFVVMCCSMLVLLYYFYDQLGTDWEAGLVSTFFGPGSLWVHLGSDSGEKAGILWPGPPAPSGSWGAKREGGREAVWPGQPGLCLLLGPDLVQTPRGFPWAEFHGHRGQQRPSRYFPALPEEAAWARANFLHPDQKPFKEPGVPSERLPS